jgi:4-diphosphocytidyl-2-C-methyl-D-erythritol kinase
VVIEIEKRLPVQGGLGGASANAVTCLLGLERILKKTLPAAERLRIAAEVGSDLPLFLIGGTVLGVGRGEQVYPLLDLPSLPCVVVTPEVGVSTPKAFAEWDQRALGLKPSSSGQADAVLKGRSSTASGSQLASLRETDEYVPSYASPYASGGKLTVGNGSDRMNELGRGLSAWLSEPYSSAPHSLIAKRGRAEDPLLWLVRAGIENDFEQVVFPKYPKLLEGKRALERAGAKYASLSGSGSTLYGLFGTKTAAGRAVVSLRKQGWAARATSTLTRRAYWSRIFDC